MGFLEYTDISFRAFCHSEKQQEVANRKYSIVKSVCDHHGVRPQTVLFIGFTPAILLCDADQIYVSELSDAAKSWLDQSGVTVNYIDMEDLHNYGKNFDAVIAMEEFFTFADSETAQKVQFEMICRVTRGVMITTLRDYKNQDFKDREFSVPAVIKSDNEDMMFLEHHDYNDPDRNSWARSVYEILGNEMRVNRIFRCRHMFFKQCAKFGYDAGAQEFLVHKNLMYKSLLRKNYEHVISLKFG